jgi:hypothetical protein
VNDVINWPAKRAYLAKEPGDDVAKHDRFVRFVVIRWAWDARQTPQIAFPLVQARILAARVEQQHPWCTLDQPSSVQALDALIPHPLQRRRQMWICWLLLFDLHRSRLVAERSDEAVSIAILSDRDRHLGLDDRVDPSDLVSDLPGALEQQRLAHVSRFFRHLAHFGPGKVEHRANQSKTEYQLI